MGQCNSFGGPTVSFLNELGEVNDLMRPPQVCCASTRMPPDEWHHEESTPQAPRSVLSQKGFIICVDSVDALLGELPYELDADLDHLYALPECNGAVSSDRPLETPCFSRDVGTCCESGCPTEDSAFDNQDNYTCLQVDDLANPWGLYAVSDGHGPQGHLVSTLLVHELPGLLVQNPAIHRDSDLALYQSFVSVGEMATTCQFVDASNSGGTLSAALLRDGFLHVAWVGDSKVVLGRLDNTPSGDRAAGVTLLNASAVSRSSSSKASDGGRVFSASRSDVGTGLGEKDSLVQKQEETSWPPLWLLRAVELTADHVTADYIGNHAAVVDTTPRDRDRLRGAPPRVDAADGAGGPPRALTARRPIDVIPRGLTRVIGNSQLQGSSGQAKTQFDPRRKNNLTSTPEVRRLRLKPEDLFVVLGTGGLWQWLTPAEAVTIVGANICRPSWCAVDALASEVHRRSKPSAPPDDLTIVVVYLAGERYVREEEAILGFPEPGLEALRQARDHLAGCGCMPQIAATSMSEPQLEKPASAGSYDF